MLKMIKKKKKLKYGFRIYFLFESIYLTIPKVYADTNDPLQVINNLSNLMASIITTLGGIILMYGIVQVGLSFNSHDPSQRVNGIMTFVAGAIIACSKFILDKIM